MKELVKRLFLFTVPFTIFETARASTDSEDFCEAIFAGKTLVYDSSFLNEEFNLFSKNHPEWMAAISWGGPTRLILNLNEPITHQYLPSVPVPREGMETIFSVTTAAKSTFKFRRGVSGTHGHSVGVYRVTPFHLGEGGMTKFAIKVNVSAHGDRLDEMDLLGLYIAIAAVPYADRLVVEQTISGSSYNILEVETLRKIQTLKKEGQSDGVVLSNVIPRMVKQLVLKGTPFEFLGRRHWADKALDEAGQVTIQYNFSIPSAVAQQQAEFSFLN